jgi:hypothetical protein
MKKLNEENACKAFIEILLKIKGIEYEKDSSPDEQNSAYPDIDYILISKDGRSHKIAVEHTVVESFEKKIAYVNQSYEVVAEINDQCKGKLPTDRYYFLIAPHPLIRALKRNRKKQFVGEMSYWICDIAKTLTEDQCSSRIYNDYKVTLMCGGSDPEENGNVWRMPRHPEKAEKLKRKRFRRAIKDKLPKLIKYKLKRITTSLLLESIGGALWDYKARWKDLTITQKFLIFMFIDYVIILSSNNQKMIFGKVWKEKWCLYSEIPQNRKFSFLR